MVRPKTNKCNSNKETLPENLWVWEIHEVKVFIFLFWLSNSNPSSLLFISSFSALGGEAQKLERLAQPMDCIQSIGLVLPQFVNMAPSFHFLFITGEWRVKEGIGTIWVSLLIYLKTVPVSSAPLGTDVWNGYVWPWDLKSGPWGL